MMTRRPIRLASLLLTLLACIPIARTADRAPLYLPNRDVAVHYRVSGRAAQQVRELNVRYTAARQLLRIETEDSGMGYLIVDPARRSARLVVPGINQVVDLPLARDRRAALLLGEGLDFTRRGKSRVLGRECTNWDVRAEHDSATLCLTDAGVLLRAKGASGDIADSALEATRVDEAPQAASMFRLPHGGGGFNLGNALRPFLQQGR